MRADDVIVALDQRFRACHGRILAALTRRFGVQRFALSENAVQDAYVRALERWPSEGTPTEPERWLVRVAHNAMIDTLRREPPMSPLDTSHEVSVDSLTLDSDDELRLMFLCSDPALARAAQIALMLNVTFGLTAGQDRDRVSDGRAYRGPAIGPGQEMPSGRRRAVRCAGGERAARATRGHARCALHRVFRGLQPDGR